MSLREEKWKYEQITGESAEHIPITKLGAFLDGFEIGIKALEVQPSKDCISTEMVIDTIKYYWINPQDFNFKDLIADICALPSVQPQRPKGKWIVLREEYEFMGGIINEPRGCECSNCNKVVGFKSNFCPNCGADMRKSEDKK